MEKTQSGLRKRICFVGQTNVGKSSLMNAIIKEDVSLISEQPGTTTDTVVRAYELLGMGAVSFCDTAGLGDETILGRAREQITLRTIQSCDLMIVVRAGVEETDADVQLIQKALSFKIPYLIVYNKIDLYQAPLNSIQTNAQTGVGIDILLKEIKNIFLNKKTEKLLDGLIQAKDCVLLVTPIDSSAPVGRMILPQMQVLRELLDKQVLVTIVQLEEVSDALQKQSFQLVITDSKVIKEVLNLVPSHMRVSTFSVLFAKAKGDFETFLVGTQVIDNLRENDKILIAESCVHTTNEDDIAKAVIPKLLQKYTGKKLDISFVSGKYLPDDIKDYRLIIQCGGCMLTRIESLRRIEQAQNSGVPITNYGLTITKCQMGQIERLTF